MGSIPIARHACLVCGARSLANFPIGGDYVIPCAKCVRSDARNVCARKPCGKIRCVVELICDFVEFTPKRLGKRMVYDYVLRGGPDSCLRQFTYGGNGLEGNISQHEDILDRILDHLV